MSKMLAGRQLALRVGFAGPDVARIHLDGELDRAGAADLSDALDGMTSAGVKCVEIDAAGVLVAEEPAVLLLLAHADSFRRRGGWLRVVQPSAPMWRAAVSAGAGPALLLAR